MMISINYRDKLREAFMAGRASMLHTIPGKAEAAHLLNTPRTFEDWIEQQSKRPTIARG